MRHALKLARRGLSYVHPNPRVGAVLVRHGKVVGAGYHRRFGGPHAEVEALQRAGDRAEGATLYVNLEPCSHWGKTPPCVEGVIAARVARVVAAMRDPFSQVDGRGFKKLRAAGIAVESGVLEEEARALNRPYLTRLTLGRPFVTLKSAATLDGRTMTAGGESKWITGPEARSLSHRLRAEADAVAVGIGTVLADNPQLTAHGKGRNPVRVIFDSYLKTPVAARCLDRSAPTWVLTTASALRGAKAKKMAARGAVLHALPLSRDRHVALKPALRWLAEKGIAHLLVEGGASLHGSLLDADAIDEVVWFMAPRVLGGRRGRPSIEGHGIARLADSHRLKDVSVTRVGGDFCVRGMYVHRAD